MTSQPKQWLTWKTALPPLVVIAEHGIIWQYPFGQLRSAVLGQLSSLCCLPTSCILTVGEASLREITSVHKWNSNGSAKSLCLISYPLVIYAKKNITGTSIETNNSLSIHCISIRFWDNLQKDDYETFTHTKIYLLLRRVLWITTKPIQCISFNS